MKTKTDNGIKIHTSVLMIWLVVAAAFVVSAVFYSRMPDRIASHWNARGEVDAWMSKSVGLWVLPAVMLFDTLLLQGITLIDPLRRNIEKFRVHYNGFILVFNLFLLALHFWMILWNLGRQVSVLVVMPIALGGLFFYIGMLMDKVKRNWIMGIRLPWTLSSDYVWEKTHRLGGILFRIAGIIVLLGALWPDYSLFFILVPVFAITLITGVYSFVIYRRLNPRKS